MFTDCQTAIFKADLFNEMDNIADFLCQHLMLCR